MFLSTIEIELLRVAHKNNLATLVVHLAAAGAVAISTGADSPVWFASWFAVVALVSLIRLAHDRHLARALSQPGADLRLASRLHAAGLLTSGMLWGFLTWVRLPLEQTEHRYIMIIVISALSGGAIGVLAPLVTTGRLYMVALMAPACLRLILAGGEQSVLGGLGVVFWVVMITGHRANHQVLVESIELREANKSLVETLRTRNAEIDAINAALEQRVADRTAAAETSALEAETANRAKSQFLANMSHEIRTPLNGVLGMAQLMVRHELTKAQRERLQTIELSAKVLLGVVNDVLDISKIEAGELAIAPTDFSLAEFAERTRRLHGPLAQEKGVGFQLTLDGDGPDIRHGDEVRLRQILGNLISNALKFTAAGEISVRLFRAQDDLICEVRDTGMGISQEDLSRIFDRFVQADASNIRQVGGAGLGLAICRELAGLMGGEISACSTPGVGSTFTLTLPMPGRAWSADKAPAAQRLNPLAGQRILVVDDHPTNRLVLQTLLDEIGLGSAMAVNGREAVEAWNAEPWAAILMDIHMPEMDGLDATRAIRERERQTSHSRTPIIAVTASVLSHETEAYLRAGMDAVVAKPVDPELLIDALRPYLAQAAAAA
jgi:signal transduction histidine kinase/ActR/RegA family two-component response regulator